MRPRKIAALIAAGMMLLTACSSGSDEAVEPAESPKSATTEPNKVDVTPSPSPTVEIDPVREAAELMSGKCRETYIEDIHERNLINDPSSAVSGPGRFEEVHMGMLDIEGVITVDGSSEELPWKCTVSQDRDSSEWNIIFIGHGDDSPFWG